MADTVRPGAARLRGVIAVLLLALFVTGGLARARVRPLWHDEIFTWHVARQPDTSAIWDALHAGADLNPPLYYVLVQQLSRVVPSDRLAVRLPALLGFAAMLVSVSVFIRRRCGSAAGGATAALIALSGVGPYAYEGRPYGLVLGCAGVALLAWQQATLTSRRLLWALTLAVALTAALSSHYYAVLLIVPLAVGETIRTLRARRVDLVMAAAIGLPLLVLWAWRPLITVARGWSGGFWSRPSLDAALTPYASMLNPLGWPLVACLVPVALVAALTRTGWLPPARTPRGRTGVPGHELAALAAAAALPAVGVALSWFVTGAWHERYGLPAIIGIAGLTVAGVHASGTLALRTGSIVLLTALAAQGTHRLFDWRAAPRVPPALTLIDRRTDVTPTTPVLVSDGLTFVEMAYSAPADLATRLVYGRKPPSVIARTGTDTENRALEQLARLAPLRVERFETFLSKYPRFDVIGRHSWVIEELQARGVLLRLVAVAGDLHLLAAERSSGREGPE